MIRKTIYTHRFRHAYHAPTLHINIINFLNYNKIRGPVIDQKDACLIFVDHTCIRVCIVAYHFFAGTFSMFYNAPLYEVVALPSQ